VPFLLRRTQTPEERDEVIRRMAEQDAAVARAEALLLGCLPAAQEQQYRERKTFDLVGSLGGHYRITYGRSVNVFRLRNGREVVAFCGAPACDERGESLPLPDVMLAQYLVLVTDEAAFIAVAVSQPLPWGSDFVLVTGCQCYLCRSFVRSYQPLP
jgi:hypothetical protein